MRLGALSRAAIDELVGGRLAAARGGRPRPLILVGDAGSGKTTLLNAVTALAKGTVVIRVIPGRHDVPYASLKSGLESCIESLAEGPRRDRLVEASHAMEVVEPSATARPRVFQLLTAALEALDRLSPVVVCVDDLHAADTETAAAFWHLVRHVRERRIWILGGLRPGPPDQAPDDAVELDRLAAADLADVVTLAALSADEVMALVADRLDGPPSAELVDLVLQRGRGNAFFTVELVEWLVDNGLLVNAEGGIRPGLGAERALPDRVGAFIVARVDAMGFDSLLVATRLALVAEITLARLPLLANLCERPTRDVARVFDGLIAAGVVIDDHGRYRLSHDLVHDALYDRIGPAERRRLHELAAKLLASHSAEADASLIEIARHVRASADPPDAGAARLLSEAGDAYARRAPAMAVGWYRSALTLVPTGDALAIDIELALSRCLGLSGRYAEAAVLATRAAGVADPVLRSRAVELAVSALRAEQRFDAAVSILDAALADPATRTSRMMLQRAQLAFFSDDLEGASRWAAGADAIGVGDRDRTMAEVVRLQLDLAGGRYELCRRRADELRVVATSGPERFNVAVSLMIHESNLGDPATALADIAMVEDAGVMADITAAMTGWVHLRCGRLGKAKASASTALGSREGRIRSSDAVAMATLVAVAVEQERLEEVAAHVSMLESVSNNRVLADTSIARWEHARGDAAGAYQRLRSAIDGYRRVGRRSHVGRLLPVLVDLATSAGDLDLAEAAHHELLGEPRHPWAVAVTMAALLADVQVTGRPNTAIEAVEFARQHGLAADAATAKALLAAINDDQRLLAEAHRELGELGATARQRAVAVQLRQARRRVPSRSSGPLTGTEAEIAGLVGQGLANKEIGQRTGLTVKTVETYVTRILAKTGYSNRTKLAIAVATRAINLRGIELR